MEYNLSSLQLSRLVLAFCCGFYNNVLQAGKRKPRQRWHVVPWPAEGAQVWFFFPNCENLPLVTADLRSNSTNSVYLTHFLNKRSNPTYLFSHAKFKTDVSDCNMLDYMWGEMSWIKPPVQHRSVFKAVASTVPQSGTTRVRSCGSEDFWSHENCNSSP